TRAAAMSYRLRGLRVALDAHRRLGDRLGGHIPTLGAAIAAARLVGLDDAELQDAIDALETGNWCRHAPPPCASGMPPLPAAVRAVVLESTLKMMAFPLNAENLMIFKLFLLATFLSRVVSNFLVIWILLNATFVEIPLVFMMFLLLIESLLVFTMFLLIEGLLIFVSLLVFESLLVHEILGNSFLIESLLVFKLCLLYLCAFVSTSTSRRRL
ncbi:unnamed protein product, partial [Prorocentrum cordatum]